MTDNNCSYILDAPKGSYAVFARQGDLSDGFVYDLINGGAILIEDDELNQKIIRAPIENGAEIITECPH